MKLQVRRPNIVPLRQRENEKEDKTVLCTLCFLKPNSDLAVSCLACFSDEAVMHGACERVQALENLGVPAEYVYAWAGDIRTDLTSLLWNSSTQHLYFGKCLMARDEAQQSTQSLSLCTVMEISWIEILTEAYSALYDLKLKNETDIKYCLLTGLNIYLFTFLIFATRSTTPNVRLYLQAPQGPVCDSPKSTSTL